MNSTFRLSVYYRNSFYFFLLVLTPWFVSVHDFNFSGSVEKKRRQTLEKYTLRAIYTSRNVLWFKSMQWITLFAPPSQIGPKQTFLSLLGKANHWHLSRKTGSASSSALGHKLYPMCISRLPTMESRRTAIFADDTAIAATDSDPALATIKIQQHREPVRSTFMKCHVGVVQQKPAPRKTLHFSGVLSGNLQSAHGREA